MVYAGREFPPLDQYLRHRRVAHFLHHLQIQKAPTRRISYRLFRHRHFGTRSWLASLYHRQRHQILGLQYRNLKLWQHWRFRLLQKRTIFRHLGTIFNVCYRTVLCLFITKAQPPSLPHPYHHPIFHCDGRRTL